MIQVQTKLSHSPCLQVRLSSNFFLAQIWFSFKQESNILTRIRFKFKLGQIKLDEVLNMSQFDPSLTLIIDRIVDQLI